MEKGLTDDLKVFSTCFNNDMTLNLGKYHFMTLRLLNIQRDVTYIYQNKVSKKLRGSKKSLM